MASGDVKSEENLYELWMLYKSKNDVNLFKEYLTHFIATYNEFIDVGFTSLNEGYVSEGPHLTRLPEGLVQLIHHQLAHCIKWCVSTGHQLMSGDEVDEGDSLIQDTLSYITDLLKCLIVISRNTDNVAFVSSCDYMTHILPMITVVLNLLGRVFGEECGDKNSDFLMSFARHALHLIECLYDPYFLWRKHLKGWQVNKSRLQAKPGSLHVEVVPFFYECFQLSGLPIEVQVHLFHVFGAIITGSQGNALKAICPATLDVLVKVLLGNQVVELSNAVQEHMELKELVLHCVIKAVHTIHTSSADMRQVEVGAVLEGYLQVFHRPDSSPRSIKLHKQMLRGIMDMLQQSSDRASLQVSFMAMGFFDTMLSFLHTVAANGSESQSLAVAVIQAINSVMFGSHTVKERFAEKVGYTRFIEALKSVGQPSRELLQSVLELAVDGDFMISQPTPMARRSSAAPYRMVLHTPQAARLLIQWLPDIQCHDNQIWLSECLLSLCRASNHNRTQACTHGFLAEIISCLDRERQINRQAVGNLVLLLEWLGSQSILSSELTQLIQLLRPDSDGKQMRYCSRMMHAMSRMARKDGREEALYYFDLTHEESGLFLPTIHKWTGTGFTFHAWLRLDHESPSIINAHSLIRRQLYSFSSTTGNGFEAFITAEATLVVAVFMKKEYHAVTVDDCIITGQQWHCVDIIHASSKRPFTQSQLTVYINGKLRLTALLKFPPLSESFTNCVIGCPQLNTNPGSGNTSASVAMETKSRLGLPFKLPLAMKGGTQSPGVVTLNFGCQDEHFGAPVSLVGHVGTVCLLQDAITPQQVAALYQPGPNWMNIFYAEGGQLLDLIGKVLFHYNPKACRGRMCSDLSSNQMNCQLVGNNCHTSDIKNVINTIGGVMVIFPLLEQFASTPPGSSEVDLMLDTPPQTPDETEWEVVPSSSYSDVRLEQNQIAGFLTLLRNLVQTSDLNQETLIRQNSLAILGALLQKVPSSLIDANVLMAIQLLLESLAVSDKLLLQAIYQYLLFDFSIWSHSQFCVRIGHIQYLNTIIKEDRKFFRKKYGVLFVLDVIRNYYSSPDVSLLSAEDCLAIRGSLFALIKFYVMKEITFQELSQIISFITAVNNEDLVSDVLDLLTSLLEARSKQDQIFLLMFERSMADMLYGLLSNKEYSTALKEKVLVVLWLLLSTDKVYEKNKAPLRLIGNGLYPGLLCTMMGHSISLDMAKMMLQQVFVVESSSGMDAALYILQMISHADVSIKLEASRQLLQALMSVKGAPKLFAQQTGWQDAIVRLFIQSPNSQSVSTDALTEPVPDTPEEEAPPTIIDEDMDYHPALDISDDENQNYPIFRDISVDRSSTTSLEDFSLKKSSSLGGLSRLSATSEESITSQCSELTQALLRMGIIRGDNSALERTEELCQNLLICLFTILWKGIEGSTDEAWKARGQVIVSMTYTGEENQLLQPPTELVRRLLEMMLQGAILDLKEYGQTNAVYMENAMHIVKLFYNFLCMEETKPEQRFRESILDDLLTLLDLLTVWDVDNEWREMERLGLRILLAFAAQNDIALCSIATARLHTLLQTRPVEKLQESCYVIGAIDAIITAAIDNGDEHYNFLIPIMKALVDKCHGMLDMSILLPNLPSTKNSPSFFDDFKLYSQSNEWRTFMNKQVLPSKEQYQANIFDDVRVTMKTFIGECHEEMMVASHKRSRQRGESKLAYQSQILDAFVSHGRQENKRFRLLLSQQKSQLASALRQWRSLKSFFNSDRGVWAESYPGRGNFAHQPYKYWKLSSQENYCRMRPKLVPNYNFDAHKDASRLRDNLELEETSEPQLADLSLVNKAKVSDAEIGDDRLDDEEWEAISVASKTEEVEGKEKLILSEQCDLITVMECVKGRLEVTTTHVYFYDNRIDKDEGLSEDFKWPLTYLREIHFRRYNLRRSALEFFLIDQTNYFINFEKKVRNKVYSRILSLRPQNLIYNGSRSPSELLRSSGLTLKWVQREITNFEYLMQLNTIAGRTYNDLSQYPVFPWILKDYTSEKLNLDNPNVYRDLSRPIGVVNPRNEKGVREKFETFEDPTGTIEKFHYGTHYSNAAGVMHYLLRMEPFTTLHIQLQNDRFDVADRQFHSIAATWQTLYDTPNDVKELIPEFFYCPEFLKNFNNFDLGRHQGTKVPVGDVELPRWASSAEEFIEKHMEALESDHVSSRLHQWIDLIFGYKQKGKAAVEALNVFYYCTYEGAVDLDAIKDPIERKALEGMINNFGQTPCQLMKEPHPARWTKDEMLAKSVKTDRPLNIFAQVNELKAFFVEAGCDQDYIAFVCVPRNQSRSFMQHGTTVTMVTMSASGVLGTHGWLPYDKNITNYFTFDKDPTINNPRTRRCLAGPFAPDIQVDSRLFAVSHDAKLLFSGGHWDNSLRIYSLTKCKTLQHMLRHTDIVTCLALDKCGSHLISGSRDTTCILWKVDVQTGTYVGVHNKPVHVLYGHRAAVTTVAISVELDMAVSGARDGLVNVHTVRRGMFLHTLAPPGEDPVSVINQVALSYLGEICVYSTKNRTSQDEEKLTLHLFSINGKHLSMETVYVPIHDMLIADRHLVFGNSQGVLVIKKLYGLKTVSTLQLKEQVTCLQTTNGTSHILVGLRDGKLIVIGHNKNPDAKDLLKLH